ncbi:MAG: HesA/MoeB/ThiF family protein [Flavobacteriaceae bacterium]|nr:HesA/MoeB/ThiF family protein [Flavobacteriaceae bacterium]
MDFKPADFYQRQTTLPEIGTAGQERLGQAKVLVAGCGGLGSVAAVYLAGSGIGTIHLVDFDEVSVSNLHRQVFYKTADIGKAKAAVLAAHIKAINPFIKVTFSTKAIAKSSVKSLIAPYDIVLDCTDSLSIKYLINDACVLENKTLVYGSLYKFDGYVATFNALDEKGGRTANLRDAFPKRPQKYIPNCAEAGTLNSIVGIIGLMQANEVLKLVTKVGQPLTNQLLIYNSLNNSQFIMKLKVSSKCQAEPTTAGKLRRSFSTIFNTETYTDPGCALQDDSLLITADTLKIQLKNNSTKLFLISVIENQNMSLPFKVDAQIPLSQFNPKTLAINSSKTYIMVCQRGITSYTTTQQFKKAFPKVKVLSLKEGVVGY